MFKTYLQDSDRAKIVYVQSRGLGTNAQKNEVNREFHLEEKTFFLASRQNVKNRVLNPSAELKTLESTHRLSVALFLIDSIQKVY